MVINWIKTIIFTLIFAVLAVIVVNRSLYFKKGVFEQAASNVIYPILRVSNSVSQTVKNIFSANPLQEELQIKCQLLEQERETVLQENVALKSYVHNLNESNEAVDFQKRYQLKNAVLGNIIGRTFNSDEHTFLINKGTRNGIEENMVAIYKFQIIGKVIEVFSWYCKVLLMSDKNCKVSAYTNMGNVKGIAQGNNTVNRVFLDYVGKQIETELGDLVLSSGQGLVFPEGFCLGKIIKCDKAEPYQRIEIEPLIDFTSIPVCSLIKREKVDIS